MLKRPSRAERVERSASLPAHVLAISVTVRRPEPAAMRPLTRVAPAVVRVESMRSLRSSRSVPLRLPADGRAVSHRPRCDRDGSGMDAANEPSRAIMALDLRPDRRRADLRRDRRRLPGVARASDAGRPHAVA